LTATESSSETHTSGFGASGRQQICQGKNGDIYECGRDSAAVLLEIARGHRVECAPRDHDRYGRVVAVCKTEAGELNVVKSLLTPSLACRSRAFTVWIVSSSEDP
jgi:hypothetical protein